MGCRAEHVGAAFKPDEQFCCKLRHMAEGGGLAIGFTYGRDDFHGPTLRERADRQLAEGKAAGMDLSPVGTRWV